jgi:hypothetical protein
MKYFLCLLVVHLVKGRARTSEEACESNVGADGSVSLGSA